MPPENQDLLLGNHQDLYSRHSGMAEVWVTRDSEKGPKL